MVLLLISIAARASSFLCVNRSLPACALVAASRRPPAMQLLCKDSTLIPPYHSLACVLSAELAQFNVHSAMQAVKVNSFGKWKTALQMTSMSLLLFCKDQTGMMDDVFRGKRLSCDHWSAGVGHDCSEQDQRARADLTFCSKHQTLCRWLPCYAPMSPVLE